MFPQAKLKPSQRKAYKKYITDQVSILRHLPPLIGLVRFTMTTKEAGWLIGVWQAELRLGDNVVATAEREDNGYIIRGDEACELVKE